MKLKDLLETPKENVMSRRMRDPYPGPLKLSLHELKSLTGLPKTVNDYCDVSSNRLTSLGGSPQTIKGFFNCAGNYLTSLEGGPAVVGGDYFCANNALTSLKGAPEITNGEFSCYNNLLETLEGVPKSFKYSLYCRNNKLTSLKNIHKRIKHVGGFLYFDVNPIESHVLGLLKIDGLRGVKLDQKDVHEIINKHLAGDKDIFACQEELIEAGYPEFAQL